LTAGTLLSGAGSLTLTITGTPASSGTASFALSIGGQTCTLTRTVDLPVGTITALSCSTATNTGTLTQGIAAASVSSSVPYTGGNGGTYTSQTITSTGVTGLTATLAAGTLLSGAGSLTYNITGTPATSGTASFALTISGQICSFTRTVNSAGQNGITSHSCGATNVHNPAQTYGTMTDQDNNVYRTIVIGSQEWMAENLKVSHYRNGDLIPIVINSSTWSGLNTGATCWYNNDSSAFNCPYGKLYNWYAVSDSRNVCPVGWHVPSDSELSVLQNYLGGWGVAGGKLKTQGITYWTSGNTGATNSTGFSGLPGGLQGPNGGFNTKGILAHFWTSTLNISQTDAVLFRLHYGQEGLDRFVWDNRHGFSVRCLKD
jgi:uncharacterized protein (TIGR02145 family)